MVFWDVLCTTVDTRTVYVSFRRSHAFDCSIVPLCHYHLLHP